MRVQQDIPLVGNPGLVGHWEPTVASDHSLPFRHAITEATVGTAIAALIIGALCLFIAPSLSYWFGAALIVALLGLLIFLYRYEEHVTYVRANREPIEIDLDHDGAPDRVKAIYYGAGAPRPNSSIDVLYRQRFADFVVACQQGTDVRSLRALGYDDTQQALFRGALIEHGAATWQNAEAHTLGWTLGRGNDVARVIRNTAWEPTTQTT